MMRYCVQRVRATGSNVCDVSLSAFCCEQDYSHEKTIRRKVGLGDELRSRDQVKDRLFSMGSAVASSSGGAGPKPFGSRAPEISGFRHEQASERFLRPSAEDFSQPA